MEEAIKVLEELISWKGKNVEIRDYEIQAIENLIKGYKELEAKLNDLVQVKQDVGSITYTMPSKLAKASIELLINSDLKMKNKKLQEKIKEQQKQLNIANKKILSQKGQLKVINTSYIPKSKVREKIEKLLEHKENINEKFDKAFYNLTDIIEFEIKVLEELLQDKE